MLPATDPRLFLGIGFVTAFGLIAGIYRLLTADQRRTLLEIRNAAEVRGWQFAIRRWQGNPTSFRITGHSESGQTWIMTHGQNSDQSNQWVGVLAIRFPSLAGRTDFAILPRDVARDRRLDRLTSGAMQGFGANFGSSVASAMNFLRGAHEQRSGLDEFDGRYRVLSTHPAPLADVPLASGIVNWPADAVIPHSLAAWRDAFAVRIQARLPGPPSRRTVEHLVTIATELTERLPPAEASPVPPGHFDRLIDLVSNC